MKETRASEYEPSLASVSSTGGPSSSAAYPSMDLNDVQLEIRSHPSPEHASEVVRTSVAEQAQQILSQNIQDSINRGTAVEIEEILAEPAFAQPAAAAAAPPAPSPTTSMVQGAARRARE